MKSLDVTTTSLYDVLKILADLHCEIKVRNDFFNNLVIDFQTEGGVRQHLRLGDVLVIHNNGRIEIKKD